MKINGVQKEYPEYLSVSELLLLEGFQKGRVAVELNEEIVAKDTYDEVMVKDSDVVEIVSFMGGVSR